MLNKTYSLFDKCTSSLEGCNHFDAWRVFNFSSEGHNRNVCSSFSTYLCLLLIPDTGNIWYIWFRVLWRLMECQKRWAFLIRFHSLASCWLRMEKIYCSGQPWLRGWGQEKDSRSLVLISNISSGLCMIGNTLCWHPSGLKNIFWGGIFTITLAVW